MLLEMRARNPFQADADIVEVVVEFNGLRGRQGVLLPVSVALR